MYTCVVHVPLIMAAPPIGDLSVSEFPKGESPVGDQRPIPLLGEHKPGRIKPGRIKRAALSLQNQN